MSEYLLFKWIHILSSTLLFGTGLGSAFYKWRTDRSGVLPAMAQTNALVVTADWIFTTPTIIIQPISGLWLLKLLGIPLDQGWVIAAVALYFIAGACWLPVVWLQIRMRDMTLAATQQGQPLPDGYQSHARIWFALGIPAFIAMVAVYALMVFKPAITL
ncbi:MAG: DUF2269 domain-containing protein [Candidatus Thiodiazotropha sp.]